MAKFSSTIIDWYNDNKRDLPWRQTKDPYKIWLSEIILQQTRVEQGSSYYDAFVSKYPTITSLADANPDDVLRLWQGLGYYSRARNLHAAAKYVKNELNGIFPTTYNEIIKLKGVGDYTASAISSFAFKEVQPVLDGNVFRVIARHYGIFSDIAKAGSKKDFKKVLFETIDSKRPDIFNQAIMEFGALHCSPKKPNCLFCPLSNSCYAFANDKQGELPVKIKKIKRRSRYFNYIIIRCNDKIALQKRSPGDIWEGLYEFLLHESKTNVDFSDYIKEYEQLGIKKVTSFTPLKKHVLSHQDIFSSFLLIDVDRTEDFSFFSKEEIEDLPKPVLITNFLELQADKI